VQVDRALDQAQTEWLALVEPVAHLNGDFSRMKLLYAQWHLKHDIKDHD